MANDIVNEVAQVGLSAVKGFTVLLGIAVGALVAKFGAEVVLDVISAGVEVIKAVVA